MPTLLPAAIRGLIFDCDGTLADTMPIHWQVWQAITQKHGLQLDEARFYSLGGVPTRDILRKLSDEQGVPVDALAVAREKELAYIDRLHHVRPIELIESVAREHRGKIPMAVASGGTHRVIDLVLEHLGIRSWFQAVVTSEDVVHQKPAPDIFLEAAWQIGVPPANCRAYEDTDLGLQAIRAAGMDAVDVRVLLGKSGS